jgi:hypothetical protein
MPIDRLVGNPAVRHGQSGSGRGRQRSRVIRRVYLAGHVHTVQRPDMPLYACPALRAWFGTHLDAKKAVRTGTFLPAWAVELTMVG